MNNNKPLPHLALCILFDVIGCASFTIPLVGEFSDVVWAPISAFLFYRMFGGRFGKMGAVLNFIEEALPFTDFIPSFTIAWVIRKYFSSKNVTSPLSINSKHPVQTVSQLSD